VEWGLAANDLQQWRRAIKLPLDLRHIYRPLADGDKSDYMRRLRRETFGSIGDVATANLGH
jgi:hypothetical protein